MSRKTLISSWINCIKISAGFADFWVKLRSGTRPAFKSGMKRVLQHSQTGLYVSAHGGFTRNWDEAHICPNLAAAMLVCARLRLNPSDFVYRIIEPETSLLNADFYGQPKAA